MKSIIYDQECTEIAIKYKLHLVDALRSIICKAGTHPYIFLEDI